MGAPIGNDYAKGNPGGGRPTLYKPDTAEVAEKLCKLGATDSDLSDFFGVDVSTIDNWKKEHEEFFQALRNGKVLADANVASRLYDKAVGFEKVTTHKKDMGNGVIETAETVQYFPPDTTAQRYWLNNRQRGRWADRIEHTGAEGKDLIQKPDEMEIARRLAFLLTGAAVKQGE